MRVDCSLRLHVKTYWNELEDMLKSDKLPRPLVHCLKSLIGCERKKAITPSADDQLIRLMACCLSEGLVLVDQDGIEEFYDVVVFVPDQGRLDLRRFFKLVPRFPGGRLFRPQDLVNLAKVEKSTHWNERSELKLLPGQMISGWPFSEGFPQSNPHAYCQLILRDGERVIATVDRSAQYRAEGIQWSCDSRIIDRSVVAAWLVL